MKKRLERQDLIRQVVREGQFRTQSDLVEALAEVGCASTQASVSRDIADMEIAKIEDGSYILKEDLYLKKMITELVIDILQTQIFVVVKTSAGTASGVAAAIDGATIPGILGTIAGDDTILVISENENVARNLSEYFVKIR